VDIGEVWAPVVLIAGCLTTIWLLVRVVRCCLASGSMGSGPTRMEGRQAGNLGLDDAVTVHPLDIAVIPVWRIVNVELHRPWLGGRRGAQSEW